VTHRKEKPITKVSVTPVKITQPKISAFDICAESGMLAINPTTTKKKRETWARRHDLYIAQSGDDTRVVIPVLLSTSMRLAWCDAITGSFFDGSGRCLSSDKIGIRSVRPGGEEAVRMLLEIESSVEKADNLGIKRTIADGEDD
jgi:hypothetical protein